MNHAPSTCDFFVPVVNLFAPALFERRLMTWLNHGIFMFTVHPEMPIMGNGRSPHTMHDNQLVWDIHMSHEASPPNNCECIQPSIPFQGFSTFGVHQLNPTTTNDRRGSVAFVLHHSSIISHFHARHCWLHSQQTIVPNRAATYATTKPPTCCFLAEPWWTWYIHQNLICNHKRRNWNSNKTTSGSSNLCQLVSHFLQNQAFTMVYLFWDSAYLKNTMPCYLALPCVWTSQVTKHNRLAKLAQLALVHFAVNQFETSGTSDRINWI